MKSNDQKWILSKKCISEIECALKYANIAKKYDLPVSLFFTGKSTIENEDLMKKISCYPNVEIGGHTWNGLRPRFKHLFYKKYYGSYYGSYKLQKTDIYKTIQTINNVISRNIKIWRTHGYRGDNTTIDILKKSNISIISDSVDPDGAVRYLGNKLISIPINCPPDHEYLVHGYYSRDSILADKDIKRSLSNFFSTKMSFRSTDRLTKEVIKRILKVENQIDPFGNITCNGKCWKRWIIKSIEKRLVHSGFATLLIHPLCMEILDNMKILEDLFLFLSKKQCYFISDGDRLIGR